MNWCPTMRRKRVRTVRLNLATGRTVPGSEQDEWRTEPCDGPLFSDDGEVCKSCAEGWAVAENFPLDRAAEFFDGALAAGDPLAAAAERTAGAEICHETLMAALAAPRALCSEM